MKRTEILLEGLLFRSRWLLAPFYFGLVLAIGLLLVQFVLELVTFVVSGVLLALMDRLGADKKGRTQVAAD